MVRRGEGEDDGEGESEVRCSEVVLIAKVGMGMIVMVLLERRFEPGYDQKT